MMRRLLLIIILVCCWGVVSLAKAQSPVTAQSDAQTITLSYFNAVEEDVVQAYLTELTLGLADYDLTLDLVDYETGNPMVHVLFRPSAIREVDGSNVTYVLNLFRTPLTDLSHSLDVTLNDDAVIFAANPSTSAVFSLGVLLLVADRCEDALKIFDDLERTITTPIWIDYLRFYRGHCALLAEDYPTAITHFESVLFTPSGDYYWASALNLAYAYHLDDQTVQSLALMQTITQNIPAWSTEYSAVMTRLAVLYIELDMLDTALEHIELAFSVDQLHRPAYYERAVLHLLVGDVSAARADLLTYLELVPNGEYTLQAQQTLHALDS